MTFPDSARIEFEHNPLSEVICQLTFPEILAVGGEEPIAFQNLVRDEYPIYERQDVAAQLGGLAGVLKQLPLPFPTAGTAHRFQTADEMRTIALTTNSISLSERRYERWADFLSALRNATHAFESVYRPAFYQRIGLRYQDLIDREELGIADRSWEDLIVPALAGVLTEDTIHGSVEQIGGNALLHLDGVTSGRIRLQYGLATASQTQRQVFVVDADIYTEERHESDDIYDVLAVFNREAGNLFRWAIRPALRDALGVREPD